MVIVYIRSEKKNKKKNTFFVASQILGIFPKADSSDTVYVADSMLGSRSEAGTSIEMQLLNIYGQDRKKIKVSLLKVQQQDNHID